MDFEVGQIWKRGTGVWETGKRIVEIDRRRSVTLLKTQDLHGGPTGWENGRFGWISAGLFRVWIEDTGAHSMLVE